VAVLICSSTLKGRLPETLRLVAKRHRKLYKAGDKEVEEARQSFRDFVSVGEKKEKETGEPVLIITWY
jgi:hypothetical protein